MFSTYLYIYVPFITYKVILNAQSARPHLNIKMNRKLFNKRLNSMYKVELHYRPRSLRGQ